MTSMKNRNKKCNTWLFFCMGEKKPLISYKRDFLLTFHYSFGNNL